MTDDVKMTDDDEEIQKLVDINEFTEYSESCSISPFDWSPNRKPKVPDKWYENFFSQSVPQKWYQKYVHCR